VFGTCFCEGETVTDEGGGSVGNGWTEGFLGKRHGERS
jgi:hypothetical protein